LADGITKLDVQSVVAGAVTDAFSNSKLEKAADAVEVWRRRPSQVEEHITVGGVDRSGA
jgi:hypothetical protein